jgi:hypothetical protein
MLNEKFPPLKSFISILVSENSEGEMINIEIKRIAGRNNLLVFMLPPVNIFALLYIPDYTG